MFKAAVGFSTTLDLGITPVSTSLTLPAGDVAELITLGIDGSNYTEVAISDGFSFEIVRLVQVLSGTVVLVTRAQEGTAAATFAAGTSVRFVWTENGVQEEAAQVGAAITITSNIVGAVTGGPAVFNIDLPVYSAGANLVLSGVYPNYTLGLDPLYSPPVGGTVTNVSGSADFLITNPTTTPVLALTTIFPTVGGGNAFGAGLGATGAVTGIRVSNTGRLMEVVTSALPNGVFAKANITVTNGVISNVSASAAEAAEPDPGSVTIVNAGTGITISGVPTTNPTVGITNTGVTAGVYEGLQINAQGQIVAVPGGFAPISSIATTTPGIVIASGGTGIKNINIGTATETLQGLVELADAADAVNFATVGKVLDPAKLKLALNSLGRFVLSTQIAGSLTGPALTHMVQTIAAPASDFVLVTANVVFSDPAAGPAEYEQVFAAGIYVNTVAHTVLPAFASGSKTISALVTAHPGGVIELRCTTPAGTQVVVGNLICMAIADVA